MNPRIQARRERVSGDSAEAYLDALVLRVRDALPTVGLSDRDLDAFLRRNRPALLAVVRRLRGGARGVEGQPVVARPAFSIPSGPPEAWSVRQRAEANLAAMEIVAALPWDDERRLPAALERLTDNDRRVVGAYSGWGAIGLEKYKARFPAGFPVPETRGLVHEYYTPQKIWAAVAVELIVLGMPRMGRALEPSAGIGRALRGISEHHELRWTAVEYSEVSSRLLRVLFPKAEVVTSAFEGWVADHPTARFDLVVANPPYGPRGAAAELDPDPAYTTKRATPYFVLRTLDLLAADGIGVYLIPTGFLSGTSPEYRRYRERALRRAHLLGAFRLPSSPPPGGTTADVVYDQLPVDLLFFRSRGGELPAVAADDALVLDGGYFRAHPEHILGTVVNADGEGWEPGMPKPRRGYQIVGAWKGLPEWTPRPMTALGAVQPVSDRKVPRNRGGIGRAIRGADEALSADLDSAVRLGIRVDSLLAAVGRNDAAGVVGHAELVADLHAWRERHGDPARHPGLRALADRRITGAERFLAVWKGGRLTPAMEQPPAVQDRYPGEMTLASVADWLWRQSGQRLTVSALAAWWREHTGVKIDRGHVSRELVSRGWCLDGAEGDELVPEAAYLTGFLWPKFDRAEARAATGDEVAAAQARKLQAAIGWRSGPDIARECLPIDSWLPLDLVREWAETFGGHKATALTRADGLLTFEGVTYALLENTDKNRTAGFTRDLLSFVGWANFDDGLWNPVRAKVLDDNGDEKLEPKSQARDRHTAELGAAFQKWLAAEPERLDRLEQAYNRQIKGYVQPVYGSEPVPVSRWSSAIRLKDYQNQGARQMLANRSGMLAFDVGLGKTYTGIAVLARARQEGWSRRPVVVVPNSIVWKWKRDFERVLPDYRVLVIGSERRIADRGPRKGQMVADPDSPAERARKWTAFQAGEADVVLLTYSALSRTKIDPGMVERYVNQTVSLRRSIAMTLAQQDAEAAATDERAAKKGKGKPTERQAADMEERVRAWIGGLLAPPKGWQYDPGIDWHALGIDLLMVDEAQNFKNLFASVREGGEVKETKRAWALDFRCASVREHSGGAGVFLLSATPAKNRPVEFFTMMHYVRPDAWQRVGIDNHESWLARFGQFQRKMVPDGGGTKLVERDVITRFKNLDELRDVINQWSVFKVAEDVGLKLPEVKRRNHKVDPTAAQSEVLAELFSELADIEEKITNVAKMGAKNPESQKILSILFDKKRGIALKMYLTYLHPELPGLGSDEKRAAKVDPTHGPKLVRCAEEVLKTTDRTCLADKHYCLDCGHIIFCDNIAVHYWMRTLLVAAGVQPERIAILNAKEAADTELRQQIVERFNGVGTPDDDEFTPPSVDIVIANAVAYEGMDLQRRTCAIHHLDVPWEPATLQQRNGRGVRQGNQFAAVTVHYYFVNGSNEIHRIDKIERKRGWMSSLVSGQARGTNTTQEEELDEAGLEELVLSAAPPEVREKIRTARAEQAELKRVADRKTARKNANRALRDVDALFRRLERETDAARAVLLRQEAEEGLDELQRYKAELWPYPWHALAAAVRDTCLWIPTDGPPLAPGARARLGGSLIEVGLLGVDTVVSYSNRKRSEKEAEGVWVRLHGRPMAATFLSAEQDIPDDQVNLSADWPAESVEDLRRAAVEMVRYGADLGRWDDWHLRHTAPVTVEALWPAVGPVIQLDWTRFNVAYYAQIHAHRAPAEQDGRLILVGGEARPVKPSGARWLPPTPDGWGRFLALAAKGDPKTLTWTELDAAARFWWAGRRFPRGARGDA